MDDTTKHTPGPWWVAETMPGRFEVQTLRDDEVAQHDDYVGRIYGASIAMSIGDQTEKRTRHNQKANANLIAAAPDMAMEIKKQIEWLKHTRAECNGKIGVSLMLGFDQSIKYLTAVLEKACGEVV